MIDFLILGGPILWLILLLGGIATLIFLERALNLHRARVDETDFLQGIFNILRRNNPAEALTLCEETPGPVAHLTEMAVRHRNTPRERLVEELDQAGKAEISRMERRLSLIALIAQIAPLLGLLGVVVNILNALLTMQDNAPFVQSSDIATSLIPGAITTAAGLMVAIPCFIAFNVLVVKIDRLVLDMHHACSEILFFFDTEKAPHPEPAPHE